MPREHCREYNCRKPERKHANKRALHVGQQYPVRASSPSNDNGDVMAGVFSLSWRDGAEWDGYWASCSAPSTGSTEHSNPIADRLPATRANVFRARDNKAVVPCEWLAVGRPSGRDQQFLMLWGSANGTSILPRRTGVSGPRLIRRATPPKGPHSLPGAPELAPPVHLLPSRMHPPRRTSGDPTG